MEKKKRGRPKFVIDYKLVKALAQIQCTYEEIGAVLGCSHDTLARDEEFCVVHKKGMDEGKTSLRRLQWQTARGGNPTMQIWLGKQYLGQRDKQEDENNGELKITVTNLLT